MHTLPEHLNSPLDVSWVRPIFICLCMFCRSFSAPLSFLAIVLSVFQVTDSDYTLGIFKLFEKKFRYKCCLCLLRHQHPLKFTTTEIMFWTITLFCDFVKVIPLYCIKNGN